MAAPAWQSYTEAGTGFGQTITVDKPPNTAAGDLLLAQVSSDDATQTITPPTGFELIAKLSGADHTNAVYWHVAGASEPAPYEWTIGTEQAATVEISRITGAHATDPIDVSDTDVGTSGAQPVNPSVTTAGPERWIGLFIARGADTGGNPGGNAPDDTNFRYREDRGSGTSGVEAYLADMSQAAAGATGAATWQLDDTTEGWTAITVAVAPVAATGLDLVRTPGEAVQVGDAAVRARVLARLSAEAAQLLEAAPTAATLARAVAAAVAAGEAALRTLALGRTAAETVQLAEVVTRVVAAAIVKAIDEAAAIGDATVRQLARGLVQVAAETLAALETVARSLGLRRAATASLAAGEALARARGLGRGRGETIATAENVPAARHLARLRAEVAALIEAVVRARLLLRLLDDSVGSAEAVARHLGLHRRLDETARLFEARQRGRVLARAADEAVAVGAAASRAVRHLVATLLSGSVRLLARLGGGVSATPRLDGAPAAGPRLDGAVELNLQDGGET